VFDRLIQSESDTSSGREHRDSAITTMNYTFTLAGLLAKASSLWCRQMPN
jgi:hypothetical protein